MHKYGEIEISENQSLMKKKSRVSNILGIFKMPEEYKDRTKYTLVAINLIPTILISFFNYDSITRTLSHCASIDNLPFPAIKDFCGEHDDYIYSFVDPWQTTLFASGIAISFSIFINSLGSLPAKTAELFGLKVKKEDNRSQSKNALLITSNIANASGRSITTGLSAFNFLLDVATLIASYNLAAAHGFLYTGISLLVIFLPGYGISQLLNYAEPFFNKLKFTLPRCLKNPVSIYLGIAKSMDTFLFYNAFDRFFLRIKLTDYPLSQIKGLAGKIMTYTSEISMFSLYFATTFYTYYYKASNMLFSHQQKRSVEFSMHEEGTHDASNDTQESDIGSNPDIIDNSELSINHHQAVATKKSPYYAGDRFSTPGIMCGFFRAYLLVATALSVYVNFSGTDITNFNTSIILLGIALLAIILVLCSPSQIASFSASNSTLEKQNYVPGSGYSTKFYAGVGKASNHIAASLKKAISSCPNSIFNLKKSRQFSEIIPANPEEGNDLNYS